MKNNINMNIDCSIAPWHDATKLSIKSFLSVIFGFTSAKQNGSAHSALPSVCTKIVPYPLLIVLCLLLSGNAFAQTLFGGGTGTECDPYIISSATHLKNLADNVNGGSDNYSGKYFKVTANITTSEQTIIGIYSHPFCGNFDGGAREGYTITHAITTDVNHAGIFGVISSGANIHDVKTAGSLTGKSCGGVVGRVKGGSSNVTISNCNNGAAISGGAGVSSGVGGIIGRIEYGTTSNVTITNCVNNAAIMSSYDEVGGIVGGIDESVATLIITDCVNNGDILGNASFVGGIAGKCGTSTFAASLMSRCENYGYICGYNYNIAGIAGGVEQNLIIDKCANYNTVEGKKNPAASPSSSSCAADIGGLVGRLYYASVVRNSYNRGTVKTDCTATETVKGVGGLVGEIRHNNSKLVNCYNIGEVLASVSTLLNVGGIVGYVGENASVINCYTGNTITETGSNYTGNVVGGYLNSGNVQYCHFREGMISTGEVTRVTRELSPEPKYCYKFSHSTSPMNATCTLNGSTKYYLGTYYNTTSYLTYTSGTYVDDALLNALNAWVDANGSEYTRWVADASPWENLGMPKFFACTPITINTFSVTPGSGQNALEWTSSPSGVASSYTIYWECPNSIINSVSGNSYSHTGLTAGNTYCYEVMAVGSGDYCAENAHSTRICRTVPTCIPPAVENFAVTQPDAKGRKLQVSWTPEANITYKLYYGVNNPALGLGGLYEVPVTVTPAYTVERLTNGQPYYFVLKPIGGDYCDGTVVYPSTVTPQCNE